MAIMLSVYHVLLGLTLETEMERDVVLTEVVVSLSRKTDVCTVYKDKVTQYKDGGRMR